MTESIEDRLLREAGEWKCLMQEVFVTDALISNAKNYTSSSCAISEAVKITFPFMIKVHTDIQTIRMTYVPLKKRFIFLTPKIGQVFIRSFTLGVLIPGFKFKMPYPSQVLYSSAGDERPARTMRARNGAIVKVGGSAPPAFGSTRRTFGIRALDLDEDLANRMIAEIQAAVRKLK